MNIIQKEAKHRLISLDVFRGITIALMILVNSPGNATPYAWLDHSAWHGCTLADVVFPFFIVIVGLSSVLALTPLKAKGCSTTTILEKIIRRTGYIFFMGLLLNAIPHFDPSTLRILGVLQRIALVYFFSSLLFLTTKIQTQTVIFVALLVGYGCLMTYTSSTLDANLVGVVDRWFFSPAHLYTPTFDPEGLLSTLPALASVLLGHFIGFLVISTRTKQEKFQRMLLMGLLLMSLGWLWSFYLPINKALWSSSYVLLTGGLALLVYAGLYGVIEIKQQIKGFRLFDLLGRHAMLVYMLHVLFLKIQSQIVMQNTAGARVNFRIYITERLFGHVTPENAALCYGICYLLLWLLVAQSVEQWKKLKASQRSTSS